MLKTWYPDDTDGKQRQTGRIHKENTASARGYGIDHNHQDGRKEVHTKVAREVQNLMKIITSQSKTIAFMKGKLEGEEKRSLMRK